MHRLAAIHTLLAVSIIFVFSFDSQGLSAETIDFNRDIRPILSDNCYACHGPDGAQRQGGGEHGLRLDVEEQAFADLGGHFAIVPGDVEASELIQRIHSTDDDFVMPPRDHRKSLTATQKKLLSQWVEQGAEWSRHWAYVAPRKQARPSVRRAGGNWIDAYITQQLEAQAVEPLPQADKRVLLRRVYFDLVGLPPSVEDIETFVSDSSTHAWETVVDRLLASPHFGERLAVYWLDLVRYADTVGYHGDQDVSVSPFRDYVINAFNANKPFDQFTKEQLAGDLLPSPTQEQLIASGYNKLGMMSAEGGAQPKEYLAKYASDRVRTASTVWLGATLGCAECHNHKFDPFTQKDFYRFAAFFADIEERGLYSGANSDSNWGPTIRVPDEELAGLLQPIDKQIEALTQAYEQVDVSSAQSAWETQMLNSDETWKYLSPDEAIAKHETMLKSLEDSSLLATGPNADTNTYTFKTTVDLNGVTGFRLEVLPHESLPAQGPGRSSNGNFVLSEFKASVLSDTEDARPLSFSKAQATFEQKDTDKRNPLKGFRAEAAIDGDEKGNSLGWAVLPEVGQTHQLVVQLNEKVGMEGRVQLQIELVQNYKRSVGHTIGRFRLSATRETPQINPLELLPKGIRELLLIDSSKRNTDQKNQLSGYFRSVAPELSELRSQLEAAKQKRETVEAAHTRLTLITRRVEPREMRVLNRGNWMDTSGEVVEPGVPHFLHQIVERSDTKLLSTHTRATRLDLANWLTSPENPLTARVFVNRLWKMLFGVGLSKVLDDLGSQGEFPTHPALLDALALEFVESGWNIKQLVKLMVMSQTYRQSSIATPKLIELDPFNRLFARQSRFRIDAELIRDNALAVSGLLVRELGGRSVKPYQPDGLLRHLNFPVRTYQHDHGSNQYRRGVYTHWQRQFLHPALQSFDAPAREECTAERSRSNTPLAALVLLNDPSYVEAARVFAERILESDAKTDEERFLRIFLQALSREPVDEEQEVLSKLLVDQRMRYLADPDAAKLVVSVGDWPTSARLNEVELASWLAVTRAVFNMHEFITRN